MLKKIIFVFFIMIILAIVFEPIWKKWWLDFYLHIIMGPGPVIISPSK